MYKQKGLHEFEHGDGLKHNGGSLHEIDSSKSQSYGQRQKVLLWMDINAIYIFLDTNLI